MTSAKIDTTSQPDEHLVGALVHNLDTGFVAMFDTYRHVVFATALRVSGRWADAEDLTAEAFLRAYRALSGYRPDRIRALKPRQWLLTIVLNLWRNGERDSARRPVLTSVEQAPDPPDPRPATEQIVEERESGRELAELLTVLPEEQRVAVVLRHVVNLPLPEIATVLGRPEGTVRSQISRGLRRLRELYPTGARLTCLVPAEPTEVGR
ncbi:MAG TPA: sigma-70 family RNA polymerase sigma factor [Pseudonocardiaceae bacterium]|nr:sigma-70 family RNA polymerase sigma factor [Pseudonocardiaceae bacterium]